jgi:hypothetical protein
MLDIKRFFDRRQVGFFDFKRVLIKKLEVTEMVFIKQLSPTILSGETFVNRICACKNLISV